MKKTVIFVVMLPLMLCLCTCAKPPEVPKVDYIKLLTEAAYSGDSELGGRIEALMDSGECVDFSALCLLCRFMRCAYGDDRYSDALRLYAGEVVLNRMDSEDFPDTMPEVIAGMGYDIERIESTQPRKADIKAALRLLRGERAMKPTVVIISETPPEKPYAVFCDALRGNVYFSENPAG